MDTMMAHTEERIKLKSAINNLHLMFSYWN